MQSHGIVVSETLKLACFVEIKILGIRQFVKGNILTMLIAYYDDDTISHTFGESGWGAVTFLKAHGLKPEKASHKDMWPPPLSTRQTHSQSRVVDQDESLHSRWACFRFSAPSVTQFLHSSSPPPFPPSFLLFHLLSLRSSCLPHCASPFQSPVPSPPQPPLPSTLCLVIPSNPPATPRLLPKMGEVRTPICSPCEGHTVHPGPRAPSRSRYSLSPPCTSLGFAPPTSALGRGSKAPEPLAEEAGEGAGVLVTPFTQQHIVRGSSLTVRTGCPRLRPARLPP